MVTDEMMKRAVEAYRKDTGAEDWQLLGWVNSAIRAALEAALPDAEPAAWVYAPDLAKGSGGFGKEKGSVLMSLDGEWINVDTPLYAAPPAPSVDVKALVWKAHNEGFGHGRMYYGTGAFGHWYGVSRVKTGCWGCVHHIDGNAVHLPVAESLEVAKAAAQADYEARIRSTLSAQVQEEAESKPLDLNITKEWFEKRAALEGDHEIGAGRRKLTASIDPTPEELAELYRIAHRIPEGWQLVPKEPTEEMKDAAYDEQATRFSAMEPEEIYRAMLAAAPAKQEG